MNWRPKKGRGKMKKPRRGTNRSLLKIGFTCLFLEDAAVKIERREERKEGREQGRDRERDRRREGRREREQKSAYKRYFIINIAFSLSRSGLLLNFALASPQIIRLFYQSKSISRNLISIDGIKRR